MKILNEYMVLTERGEFIKVMELEGGVYLRHLKSEYYQEIGQDYFKKCMARTEHNYKQK